MINPWRKVYDLPQSRDPYKYGIPKFALYIDVEPTNNCNFSCLFCARQQMNRPIGYMSLELLEKICKQASEYGAYGIRLLRWGEPLLHPDIIEFINIIRKYNLLSHITTNGSLLNTEMAKNIIESKLDSIIISLQGTTDLEYNKLRNTNKYRLVHDNIIRLSKLREELNSEKPYIQVTTTVTDESAEDIEHWKSYWMNYIDEASWGYTWFKRIQNKRKIRNYLERQHKLPHYFKCIEVMNKLSIDWDGTVSPCCLDYDQQLTIGNINNSTLLELWNSEELKAIRTLLGNKRQDLLTLCSTCELNYPFRGKIND